MTPHNGHTKSLGLISYFHRSLENITKFDDILGFSLHVVLGKGPIYYKGLDNI